MSAEFMHINDGEVLSMSNIAPPFKHSHEAEIEALRGPRASPAVVLYVEDDAVSFLFVQHLLANCKAIRLVGADSVSQAISQAAHCRPQLMLLDMHLPDGSGLEALAAIRSDPAMSQMKVVAMSASDMPADVEAARVGGADDYWTKPFRLDGFQQRLLGLLATPQEA
jgi:CheY-like chemotaxis protein